MTYLALAMRKIKLVLHKNAKENDSIPRVIGTIIQICAYYDKATLIVNAYIKWKWRIPNFCCERFWGISIETMPQLKRFSISLSAVNLTLLLVQEILIKPKELKKNGWLFILN